MKKIIIFLYIVLLNHIILSSQESNNEINSLNTPLIFHSVNIITGEYCEAQTDMTTSGLLNFKLRRSYDSLSNAKWDFNAPNLIHISENSPKEEEFSNKKIYYEYDQQKRLKSLKIGDYVQLRIERSNNQTQECHVSSHDSLETFYRFSQNANAQGLWTLDEVKSSQNPLIRYEYTQHPQLRAVQLQKRLLPEGRYLLNEYYSLGENTVGNQTILVGPSLRDHRIGKIKLQKEPLGIDETPIISRRYIYGASFTEVYDALDNKIIYRYTPHQRLLAIENYEKQGSGYRLYRKERFFWDEKQIPGRTLLISRALEDQEGRVHICRTFQYDAQGNLTKETLYGNLTGENTAPLTLDEFGIPFPNGIESYSKTYTYTSKEPFLLLSKKEDNGKRTRYHYYPETNLLAGKLLYHFHNVIEREFYFYDDQQRLYQTISDDGASVDCENMQGVHHRQITTLYLRNNKPAYGLPDHLEIKTWDHISKEESLWKAILYRYDAQGRVIGESSWDKEYHPIDSWTYQYDSKGRVVQKTDLNGQTTLLSYDENNNLIKSIDIDKTIYHTYDYANRLIKRETMSQEGQKTVENYSYDFMGNLLSYTDSYGNTTRHTYDEFCRKIRTEHPPIQDSAGYSFTPIETFEYDIFDNIIKKTDPYGATTLTSYNIRGKPTKIIYADGSEETFIYDLEGSLKKEINRKFHITMYERDAFGQVTNQQTTLSSGKVLNFQSFTYQHRKLIEQSDLSGKTIRYEYSKHQHPSKVEKINGTESYTQEQFYNTKNQLIQTKYYPSNSPHDYYLTHLYRDESGEVKKTEVSNSKGELIQASEAPEEAILKTTQETRLNSLGQYVKCLIQINQQGLVTESFYDALNHLEKIILKDAYGTVLEEREYNYDFYGRKIREKVGNHVTLCFYGLSNQPYQIIEGAGLPQQKISFYDYNRLGQKIKFTKPDGVSLFYIYSDEGLVEQLFSSDGSIDYLFEYTPFNEIAAVHDKTNQTSTLRKFNPSHHLTEETLPSGMTFKYDYNELGQKVGVHCPDSSSILYEYDNGRLSTIKRLDSRGVLQHLHSYERYDLNGHIIHSKADFDIFQTYNSEGRQVAIDTPFWNQSIEYENGKIKTIETRDAAGHNASHFDYDAFGRITLDNTQNYSYDAQHNRLFEGSQYNSLNHLIQLADQTFQYDQNGNLIKKRSPEGLVFYSYDALNRLKKVQGTDFIVEYQYDGFHRKIARTTTHHGNSVKEFFLYDGFNEIGLMNEEQNIVEFRVLGKGLGAEIGAAVLIELQGKSYVPLHDHRGSIVALIDKDSQECVETYHYDAFGKTSYFNSQGQKLDESLLHQPWLFNGKRLEELVDLYDFGKRFYDPCMGRWTTPDPLEDFDDNNRYLFVKNDPINQIDLYGLFSINHSTPHQAGLSDFFWEFNDFIKKNLSFEEQLRNDLEKTSVDIFGKIFLIMLGYYEEPMETGIYGYGELNDKVRITMINGMLNVRLDCISSATLISQTHGYSNVHYVFHPSDGYAKDLLKMLGIKLFGYVTPQAKMLARTWKTMIAEMGGLEGGGVIYHYAHSYGGADTYIAQTLLSPEEQQMIKVMTFGTAKIIPNRGFQSVVNYISRRDAVPGISDPITYLQSLMHESEHVVFLGSWWGIPFADHSLTTETYCMVLEGLGRTFLQSYGYQ